MKKRLTAIVILVLALFWLASIGHTAGTVTVTKTPLGEGYWQLKYEWTADASDATVPSTASEAVLGYVMLAVTDPGATAPTDNYSITLTDSTTGMDVMGGELASRDYSATEQAIPKIDSVYGARFVNGTLTMALTGNSVNSATGVLYVYIVR